MQILNAQSTAVTDAPTPRRRRTTGHDCPAVDRAGIDARRVIGRVDVVIDRHGGGGGGFERETRASVHSRHLDDDDIVVLASSKRARARRRHRDGTPVFVRRVAGGGVRWRPASGARDAVVVVVEFVTVNREVHARTVDSNAPTTSRGRAFGVRSRVGDRNGCVRVAASHADDCRVASQGEDD